VTGSGTVLSSNVSAGTQFLFANGLSLTNGSGLASNYRISLLANTGVITPATLTYVANPSTQFDGVAFPTFTGTVTGFVNNQSLATATTGAPQFTTTATPSSPPGSYAIDGSGLTADHGNYVFVQAAGNATALTLDQESSGPSQFTPPPPPPPNNPTTITFQNPNFNLFHVSFTPNGPFADNGNNSNPASIEDWEAYSHNHGHYYPPISQYDANQYSNFKLPPYDHDDSEATILTIIARAIAGEQAANYMIDGFWNGINDTWPGPGNINFFDKVTFSDGAGHDATPTNDGGFPIVPGKTDFAALLKNGPVVIGGSQTPGEWLLAVGLAPDGKSIICDDPITGKLVELAYDQSTETLGGIIGVFDADAKGFIALADASGDIPANDASGLASLQSFVPSTYYAVTVH
jgi:hypothetical protein